jgi:hypothetical protein
MNRQQAYKEAMSELKKIQSDLELLKEKQEEVIKGSDEKGFYCICPRCKNKCYYQGVGRDGWVCECLNCDLLFDED